MHIAEDETHISGPEVIQSDPEVIQSGSMRDKLIEVLRDNPHMSRSKLSKLLGISERQVRKIIDELRIQGKLMRVGSDTNGRWIFP